jgi:hypothetical protein
MKLLNLLMSNNMLPILGKDETTKAVTIESVLRDYQRNKGCYIKFAISKPIKGSTDELTFSTRATKYKKLLLAGCTMADLELWNSVTKVTFMKGNFVDYENQKVIKDRNSDPNWSSTAHPVGMVSISEKGMKYVERAEATNKLCLPFTHTKHIQTYWLDSKGEVIEDEAKVDTLDTIKKLLAKASAQGAPMKPYLDKVVGFSNKVIIDENF